MASGWNLWVWLQCIGVASRCCYKEVYRYPHNTVKRVFFAEVNFRVSRYSCITVIIRGPNFRATRPVPRIITPFAQN